ncbi:MAG: hypothetical protein J5656_06875 [Clostridia bacterium]|nr:hypothetical protein [Clostridia bacterium]
MKRITITINEDLYDLVKDVANASDRSVSNQISCCIKESLDPIIHEAQEYEGGNHNFIKIGG